MKWYAFTSLKLAYPPWYMRETTKKNNNYKTMAVQGLVLFRRGLITREV